jgi:hypothetical protein
MSEVFKLQRSQIGNVKETSMQSDEDYEYIKFLTKLVLISLEIEEFEQEKRPL